MSHSSEGWQSKICLQALWGSCKDPLLVCRQQTFHCVLTWWKGEGALWSLFGQGTNPIHEGPTLITKSPAKGPTS